MAVVKGYRVPAGLEGEVVYAVFESGAIYSTAIRPNADEFNPEGTEWHKAHRLPLGAALLGEFPAPVEE